MSSSIWDSESNNQTVSGEGLSTNAERSFELPTVDEFENYRDELARFMADEALARLQYEQLGLSLSDPETESEEDDQEDDPWQVPDTQTDSMENEQSVELPVIQNIDSVDLTNSFAEPAPDPYIANRWELTSQNTWQVNGTADNIGPVFTWPGAQDWTR